jgi:hypothetical protein
MGDMFSRRLVICVLVALAVAAPARAESVSVVSSRDASFPFWCDWGWDWEWRCAWMERAPRLLVGGDSDKVWRAGLSFALDAVPRGAFVEEALLFVKFDGSCLGADGTAARCGDEWYSLEAWSIIGKPWFEEREPELGELLGEATFAAGLGPEWVVLDVSAVVRQWVSGELPNHGVLLKLVDAQEAFGGGGPRFFSTTAEDVSSRPFLEVTWDPPPARA